ncbi:MAG: asparaginase domain-containing protein [Candidatus Nanoarchaeia archaeon]
MKILFIQTGGTIDKEYEERAGVYNFRICEPAVKRILDRCRVNFEFEIESLLKKDSQDITNEERRKIFEVCSNTNYNKIIITHRTDTMIKTAEILSKIKNKIIILTGASQPEKFRDSDAAFNVGTAVGAINLAKEGIYIAMNGRIYHWDECEKDKETGRFFVKEDGTHSKE